jgi:hypothetical protein
MVQRYVKFGNFRSPVAASFAALQKVRSAPPVTGLLLSAVRRLLFAVCYPPSAARRLPLALCCSLPAARCSPSAVRRLLPVFVACCLCLLFALRCPLLSARYSLPATTARRRAGRFLSGKPVFVRICAESAAYVCRKEINVILFGFRRCRNGIFVYICTNKQR